MDTQKLVQDGLIYEVRAGSHAYGTNLPESDEDFRGVAALPKDCIIGLFPFEQYEDNQGDRMIYSLHKFFKLAAECNPNVLELLYVRDEDILFTNGFGKVLRDNRDIFLSKKAKFKFSGYAFAQLNRIKRHRHWLLNPPSHKPVREEFNLPTDRKLVKKDEIGAFYAVVHALLKERGQREDIQEELRKKLNDIDYQAHLQAIGIPDEVVAEVKDMVEVSDTFLAAMQRERAYNNALQNWNQYQNWKKNRNPDRAKLEAEIGYDCKHGMHLIRLLRMGFELLTTGTFHVYRPDREELLEIRQAKVSYEDLMVQAETLSNSVDLAYDQSKLPRAPDREAISNLLIEMHEEFWLWNE